jgi:hypothetical protein
VAHPNGVRIALQRRREQRHRPPPLAMRLRDKRAQNLVVRPHDLKDYDPVSSPEDKYKEETDNDSE